MPQRQILFSVLILILSSTANAQPTTQSEIRRGVFHLTFTEQSPLSPIEAQHQRHHIKIEANEKYDLSQESFEAIVPEDYDPQKACGLFVWVNAGSGGNVPRDWPAILAKHNLICVGANNSGNMRPLGVRFGLAIDAVHNMKKIYHIDDSRIYLAGPSGGGKVVSMLGIIYPDIFSGALPMVGVAYFRSINVPNDPTKAYPPMFERPTGNLFERAKTQSRFVLITGTNDPNRDPTSAIYHAGFLSDGFQHVQYVEVPGMGHQPAPAEVLDQAIDTLDAPLIADAPKNFEKALALEKAGKIADARLLFEAVAAHGPDALAKQAQDRLSNLPAISKIPPTTIPVAIKVETTGDNSDVDEREAQSLYSLAVNYERNKMFDQARLKLEKILNDHPDSQVAAKASLLLKRIKTEQ